MNRTLTKALLLLLLVISVSSLSLVAIAQQLAKFEDNFNKYSLEYPAGWSVKKSPQSKNLIKAEFAKNGGTGVQIRIYNNKKDFKPFVNWYVGDYVKQMSGHHNSKVNVIKKEFSKPGMPQKFYVTMDFQDRSKKKWFVKQYLWPRRNQVLVLQAGTPYEEKESFEKVIDNMADSLRFLK